MERSQILFSLDDLGKSSSLAVFGAGETGQEFVKNVHRSRPDIKVRCFVDSYRSGQWNNIPIVKPDEIKSLNASTIIIASVFWNEISDVVKSFDIPFKVLSNNLINQSSHLSSYGPFYFDDATTNERIARIESAFRSDDDIEIYRRIVDLRSNKNEREFFEFSDNLVRKQKKSFSNNDKYARHLDLTNVENAIEGGVFDGQDTYSLLESLKKSYKFKKLYAFDPFLDSLNNGPFVGKIDGSLCEFHGNVLWDKEEKVSFKVDRSNPANSKVVVGGDIQTTTIDKFSEENNVSVDLIKLDVEGSEMNVLRGGRKSIAKYKPKMAVSIYHRKEHLFEIPEFLLSIHPDYRFRISMSNPTFVDMVLYAE